MKIFTSTFFRLFQLIIAFSFFAQSIDAQRRSSKKSQRKVPASSRTQTATDTLETPASVQIVLDNVKELESPKKSRKKKSSRITGMGKAAETSAIENFKTHPNSYIARWEDIGSTVRWAWGLKKDACAERCLDPLNEWCDAIVVYDWIYKDKKNNLCVLADDVDPIRNFGPIEYPHRNYSFTVNSYTYFDKATEMKAEELESELTSLELEVNTLHGKNNQLERNIQELELEITELSSLRRFDKANTLLFSKQKSYPHVSYLADFNGDGNMDVLTAGGYSIKGSTIGWYEIQDDYTVAEHVFDNFPPSTFWLTDVYAADLDNDGDLDALLTIRNSISSKSRIIWYENTDGQGSFGNSKVITSNISLPYSVHTSDFDGDGDLDVLWASVGDGQMVWSENTDGKGKFKEKHVIATGVRKAYKVHSADLDGDGDPDAILAAIKDGDNIIWYENTDGKGSFKVKQVIFSEGNERERLFPQSIYAADLDGDGDLDVLAGIWKGITVWFENTDGQGSFGTKQVISNEYRDRRHMLWKAHAVDLDDDGDLDVLSAEGYEGLYWYENTDGQGSFGAGKYIATEYSFRFNVADLDGDGVMDVVSTGRPPYVNSNYQTTWYKHIPSLKK